MGAGTLAGFSVGLSPWSRSHQFEPTCLSRHPVAGVSSTTVPPVSTSMFLLALRRSSRWDASVLDSATSLSPVCSGVAAVSYSGSR